MSVAFGLGVGFIIGRLVSRWRRKSEEDNNWLPIDTDIMTAGLVLMVWGHYSSILNQ